MSEKSTLLGKKHLKKYSQKPGSIIENEERGKMPQSIKSEGKKRGGKEEKKKKKSKEKLADAYCQRHHQRSIYSGIYSSARGEHLCLVTSERQLPFQCCLIKTSQAAPLDCFDA